MSPDDGLFGLKHFSDKNTIVFQIIKVIVCVIEETSPFLLVIVTKRMQKYKIQSM